MLLIVFSQPGEQGQTAWQPGVARHSRHIIHHMNTPERDIMPGTVATMMIH